MRLIVSIPELNLLIWHVIENKVFYISVLSLTQRTGHFTSQERKRVLGQSGDFIFEKHYQKEFIQRDLQHVVLLRPSQEGLVQRAAGMLKNRDPMAPAGLTDEQMGAIRRHPEVLGLRRKKEELKEEMRSLAGTIQNAQKLFPDLYRMHKEVGKKLAKSRKALRDNTRQTARKDYFHAALVLEVNRQIEQLLSKSDTDDDDANGGADDEDWQRPIPKYVFAERTRLSMARKRKISMQINCLQDVSKLRKTWSLSPNSVSQTGGANGPPVTQIMRRVTTIR
jgi:hypothetical protein